MWRSARNYALHLARRQPHGWYPLLAIDYLTYACDERCAFCCDGSGTPFPELPRATLPGPQALDVVRRLRRHADHLVLTGGEPLTHPGLGDVLSGIPELRFDSVILTTRAAPLASWLPAVNAAVSHLVISLDTLDAGRARRLYGSPTVLPRIHANLDAAAAFAGRRYEIVVSAVATPDNLRDLPELSRFCRERGFGFALCPQLVGVKPHPLLHDNADYREVFERLREEKKRGARVNGSPAYLAGMRDLARFRCHPSTLVAVTPLGDVLYPCLEIGQPVGNLLEQPDLHSLRRLGRERFGEEPRCDTRCHSACALGFAQALEAPWTAAAEAASVAWRALRTRRSRDVA